MYDLKGTGDWERVTHPDQTDVGIAGRCDECGYHITADDGGAILLDGYLDVESASLVLCPSCYLEARGVRVVKIEPVGDITTTPEFWDCECPDKYIRPAFLAGCLKCGAEKDEMPDSRIEEVENAMLGRRPKPKLLKCKGDCCAVG